MFDVAVVRLRGHLWSCPHMRGPEFWYVGPVVGFGTIGGRVCNWHQKILKLMSYLFSTVVICFLYI